MRLPTGEIQGISRMQFVVFNLIQPEFAYTAYYVDALLALVVVRAAAGGARSNPKEMRLHGNLPHGE
jgi:hypothetical protein